MTEAEHNDSSLKWLTFFFVCFVMVMVGIGGFAILNYNVNAPEPAPSGGGHHGMLPQSIHVTSLA